jgi:CubicO group peptidase (beta-lactamase class C family)
MKNPKELKARLLDPLGIRHVDTGQEYFGVIGDISLRPRDMLRFGLLYLNNGVWDNKQVVPAGWIAESTEGKIQTGTGDGYGYFWWTRQFTVKDKSFDCYYAWGYGGQYIFVVPSLKLVVVMTGSNWIMDEKKYAFAMMQDYILPAFSS